jgi:hypothetical protein
MDRRAPNRSARLARWEGGVTDASSAPAIGAALRFDYIAELLGIASYTVSAQEAGRRGKAALLEVHAKAAHLALISALEVWRELGTGSSHKTAGRRHE